jgi:hypothetical protein
VATVNLEALLSARLATALPAAIGTPADPAVRPLPARRGLPVRRRARAGAVIGVLLAAVEEWSEDQGADLPPIVDAALEHLESGGLDRLPSHSNV